MIILVLVVSDHGKCKSSVFSPYEILAIVPNQVLETVCVSPSGTVFWPGVLSCYSPTKHLKFADFSVCRNLNTCRGVITGMLHQAPQGPIRGPFTSSSTKTRRPPSADRISKIPSPRRRTWVAVTGTSWLVGWRANFVSSEVTWF